MLSQCFKLNLTLGILLALRLKWVHCIKLKQTQFIINIYFKIKIVEFYQILFVYFRIMPSVFQNMLSS